MTDDDFVEFLSLLKAGHAAHPQCWADTRREKGAAVDIGKAIR
jgi:hypothetical protein